MQHTEISLETKNAINQFKMPKTLGFGSTIAPIMISCDYKDGSWGELEVLPYGDIKMKPTASVLHYAQEIFEGMKAYRKSSSEAPYLFRPDMNAKRFNYSARRMAMPEMPESMFLKAAKLITAYSADFIPTGMGESLYLRPFMFANEESLGLRPSNSFKFLVVASPSGNYFKSARLDVLIEREQIRACKGGTGSAKTGGNYSGSLVSYQKIAKLGLTQTLWLDAIDKDSIEELSGMNFFAIINGELVTPELTDTILHGITRDSIIQIAKNNGLNVIERSLGINELLQLIKSDECTECFACGTAAVIAPIASLNEENGEAVNLQYPDGKISIELKNELLAIQRAIIKSPNSWVVKVDLPTSVGLLH